VTKNVDDERDIGVRPREDSLDQRAGIYRVEWCLLIDQ
jgi:hypothetical protein